MTPDQNALSLLKYLISIKANDQVLRDALGKSLPRYMALLDHKPAVEVDGIEAKQLRQNWLAVAPLSYLRGSRPIQAAGNPIGMIRTLGCEKTRAGVRTPASISSEIGVGFIVSSLDLNPRLQTGRGFSRFFVHRPTP